MNRYSLDDVPDRRIVDRLRALIAHERSTDAEVLAHIGEVDARKLYLPAACSTMHGYCVQVLHLSEDAAWKRIAAARAARRFPAMFDAVAEGRLHLSGVVMLAPHLTDANVAMLIDQATHRSKAEIAVLIARHAPGRDVPARVERMHDQLGLAAGASPPGQTSGPSGPGQTSGASAPGRTAGDAGAKRAGVRPLAPERFALQLTVDQTTHDKLVRAQAMLRHQVPSGDLAKVLDRALDALLDTLERSKRAKTDVPRAPVARRSTGKGRHVPNHVVRAVFERDGERCTFIGDGGRRCEERGFLELDHVEPVARGGEATVEGIRVLCRSHNQHEAERLLGAELVGARRDAARAATAARALEQDVLAGLRRLGVTLPDARRAIAGSAGRPAASDEERMRQALLALGDVYGTRCAEGARPTLASRCRESTPRWTIEPDRRAGPEVRATAGRRSRACCSSTSSSAASCAGRAASGSSRPDP